MISGTLILVAGFQLGCLVWLYLDANRPRWSALLAAVGLGTTYDAAVFGLGSALGEGSALWILSIGRFLGHVTLTPLLVVWALRAVFGVQPIRAWALAVALIGWGAAADLRGLDLEARDFADTLRYAAATPHGPPIPALIVAAIVLAAGIRLWLTARRTGLLLGAIVLLVSAVAAVSCPPLGNVGEALLFAAVVVTTRRIVPGAPGPRAAHRAVTKPARPRR
ncbi:hypothetical protein H0264_26035 [Nocardia huaxiensis]|uniref:Membrane-associated phospholipid phosphatase n=1 Tax=Nocardia huaxiensis TaxID=2755382 RepID=A0A7D6V7R9_9NOCA|nr:hypothetical protein [Nocardia huaxiensis]QLY28774.1 hypothetical protein H0264_26035 [Nocardia huaxiensis]